MNLESIQQAISSLIADTSALSPESFKEQLYCAYRSQLLNSLQRCASPVDFKTALEQNWSLVKSNAFCYTARPEDPLTLLLCEIAENISEELKVSPIHLLMPGVVTESIYTERDSAYQDYPDLINLPLKEILKTHILADSGSHLIPVRMLLELPRPWETNRLQFGNYHYENGTVITEKELQRLTEHSADSKALVRAKEEYESLTKDAGLLSHLQTLIRALRSNSVSGAGSEEAAGQALYWALSQFNDYYQKLGYGFKDIPKEENEKQENDIPKPGVGDGVIKIPEPVKTFLDRLLMISFNADANRTATVEEKCANIGQMKLSKLVKTHEAALASIGIDHQKKAQLLTAAKERFESNRDTLVKLLKNKNKEYVGQDMLHLTHQLLESYSVKPTITNVATLQDFLTLNAEEINLIATKEEQVRAGIMQQLPNLEALVLFCLTTPLEPLEAIVSVMGNSLSEKLIKSHQDVSAFLMMLEGPRLERVKPLLAERLPNIIKCSADFKQVLQQLSPEQCSVVCEALKAKLPTLIKSGVDFGQVLQELSSEQCSAVCEVLKAQLPTFIKSGDDFSQALAYLSPEQRSVVYEAFKAQLPTFIKTSSDFSAVLQYLSAEQRSVVYEAFKAQLPTFINSGAEFGEVLQNLSPEQCSVVYEALKAQLPTFIKSAQDLGDVLKKLSPVQCSSVYEAVEAKLPTIIESREEFSRALYFLNPEKCRAVCEVLKAQLPTLIKCGDDFRQVLVYLSPEKCSAVCEALKEQLPTFIKSGTGFSAVLQNISAAQRSVVYEAFKAQLPTFIKSGADFGEVLQNLSFEQCSAVCEALKEQLPTIIQDGTDFARMLNKLEIQKCEIVCHSLKQGLLKIINKTESKYIGFDSIVQSQLSSQKYAVLLSALAGLSSDVEMAFAEENPAVFTPNRKRHLKVTRNDNNKPVLTRARCQIM